MARARYYKMHSARDSNMLLEEILSEFDKASIIPQEVVKEWMESTDIEVLGALMTLLTEEKHYQRIEPPINFSEYYQFILNYYGRCISENPNGDWADSRTTAGWDFTKWFINLWDDPSTSPLLLLHMKEWLETIYKQGSEEVREGIVTSILEHLFQREDIVRYFADWRADPVLSLSYVEGLSLASLHVHHREKQL